MKAPFLRHLVVVACLGILGAASAQAKEQVKFPADKDPAFLFFIPSDWTKAPIDKGPMVINSADHYSAMSVYMAEDEGTLKASMDEVHTAIFTNSKMEETDPGEQGEFGGKKASIYHAKGRSGEIPLEMKLILVRLDEKHLAILSVTTVRGIPEANKRVVDAVLDTFKFTTGK